MPMEGKVMTPKAAQSSCGGKQGLFRSLGTERREEEGGGNGPMGEEQQGPECEQDFASPSLRQKGWSPFQAVQPKPHLAPILDRV